MSFVPFRPPAPVSIGGGGGSGGGTSIIADGSSVALEADQSTGTNNVTMTTNNITGMVMDAYQNMTLYNAKIPTIPRSRLTITPDPTTYNCITLYGGSSKISTFNLDSAGVLNISNNGNPVKILNGRFDIASHNGSNNGLYLGGTLVLATANQMNYLLATPGTATPLKCIVADSNNSISGITNISSTNISGTLTTASQPNIKTLSDINITTKFSLDGDEVLASAFELNYLMVTPGTASAVKALVVDGSKNISGINILSASTFVGTIETAQQPNINLVGTLANLNVDGNVGIGTTTPQTKLEIKSPTNTPAVLRLTTNGSYSDIYTNSSGDININPSGTSLILPTNKNIFLSGTGKLTCNLVEATTLEGTLLTPAQPNITSIGTLETLKVNSNIFLGVSTSTYKFESRETNGSCIKISRSDSLYCTLDITASGSLSIAPTNNISFSSGTSLIMTNGNITGVINLVATNLTGTIQTAAQPNITSVGTLGSLAVTNGITATSVSATTLTGLIQTAAQPNITSVGTLGSLAVLNGITSSSLTATSLTGTLQTAAQPNITSVGTLINLDVTGTITCSTLTASQITGTLQTPSQTNITSVGTLGSLTVTNGITASSLTATSLTGTLQTAAQPNITSIGTLGSLAVTNGITASSLTASQVTGTLQTAAQPNITSVGTLGSLAVTNGISCSTLTAPQITGSLLTAAQTNITSVGYLNGLAVSGQLGIGTNSPTYPLDLNVSMEKAIRIKKDTYVSEIFIDINGDLNITSTSTNKITLSPATSLAFSGGGTIYGLAALSVSQITGTLQTAAQPNITSIGTLTDLGITNQLKINTTDTSTAYTCIIGSDGGNCLKLNGDTGNTTLRVIGGNLYVAPTSKNIYLSQDTNIVLNGGSIIGYSVNLDEIYTTITKPTQPNITSLGTLTELGVNGLVSITYPTGYALTVTGNTKADGTLYVTGTATFTNTSEFQSGITTSSILSSQEILLDNDCTVNGDFNIDGGLYMNGQLIDFNSLGSGNASVGTVNANQLFMADANKNLSGFNELGCTSLTGTLQTAAQPNITSVGTLTGLNVSGYLGVGTTTPSYQIESKNIDGNCLKLTNDTSYLAFDVDTTNSKIQLSSNLPSFYFPSSVNVCADKISIGNTTNSTLPIEIGYTPFNFTSAYAYNNSLNGHGTVSAGSTFTYNYSIRALGRILCTQSVDITSDIRAKKDITLLSDEFCEKFIMETNPVKFHWKNGDTQFSYGYIAQDLLKNDFSELVGMDPDETMEYEQDENGVISPEGIKYNISYTYIIPILAQNQKKLIRENRELKDRISNLEDLVRTLLERDQ